MNTLVLRSQYRRLHYSFLIAGQDSPLFEDCIENHHFGRVSDMERSIRNIKTRIETELMDPSDFLIVFVLPYGGREFQKPVLVDDSVLKRLKGMIPEAPLHLPPVIELIGKVRKIFKGHQVGLCFQTSLFSRLPLRERYFALPMNLSRELMIERYGFYGLFHEAAVLETNAKLRESGKTGPYKILSVCLEPRPEVAAITGRMPVMVTTDATPMGSICGETTSGEIDSTIVLMMSKKLGYSPERINEILTRESGVSGICGKRLSLPEVLGEGNEQGNQALCREMIRYQLLKAMGAGIAAMGGLDAIVFSGRYASLEATLSPWLLEKAFRKNPVLRNEILTGEVCSRIDRIASDQIISEYFEVSSRT